MAKKKKIINLDIPLGEGTLLPEAVPRSPVITAHLNPGAYKYVGGEKSRGLWLWLSMNSAGYLTSVYIPKEAFETWFMVTNHTNGTEIYVRYSNSGMLEVSEISGGAVAIKMYQFQY